MTTIWNPQVLLGVEPHSNGYTCRGEVKTGKEAGKRCGNQVNKPDRMKAARLLDTIAYHRPTSTAVHNNLREIARLCLCKGPKHRVSQLDDVVAEWTNVIAETFPRRGRTESLSYSSSDSRTESTSSRYARSLAPSDESMTRSSTRSGSSRTSEESGESVQSRPNSTHSQHSRHSSTSRSPSENVLHSVESTDVHHTSHTHNVTRRPITEACGICYEAIHTLEDAVWCRAECGQNIHRECWDLWSAAWHSLRSGSDVHEEEQPICVFCRAPWVETETTSSLEPAQTSSSGSSSSGSSSLHTLSSNGVTRRPITDSCGICIDAIQTLDDAVWCRGQCGQNLHVHCWDEWIRQQSSNRSTASMDVHVLPACVYCRAPWVE